MSLASGQTPEAPLVAYRRLPGRSWGLLGKASLWQGSDHILLVESRGYSELYRRFYFREIQALVLRRTSRSRNWSVILAALSVILFAAAGVSSGAGAWFWGVLGVPFAVALFVHAARGPSCAVHVRTAIDSSPLAALCRVRPAERALERITALVQAVQGETTLTDIARLAESETPSSSPLTAPSPTVEAAPPPLPAQRSAHALRRHQALFLLLFADAAVAAGKVWAPGQVFHVLALTLGVAEFMLAIFALVEGRRLRLDPRLRRVTTAVLVYVCAAFVASWANNIVSIFRAIAAGTLKPGTVPTPIAMPWLAMASMPLALFLGVLGLLALRRARLPGEPG